MRSLNSSFIGKSVAVWPVFLALVQAYERDDDDKRCLESDGCRMTVGFFLLLVLPLLICWNEHTHTRLAKLYKVAKQHIRNITAPPGNGYEFDAPVPPFVSDGEFVCCSGLLGGAELLQDNLFPTIKVESALLLKREIEIYQYREYKSDNSTMEIEEVWSSKPLPDPRKHKDKKNPVGNWNIFSASETVDTGDTFQGEKIEFGDNLVVQRASNPVLEAPLPLSVPTALVDEAFFPTRNVYRLREFGRLKDFQGTWQEKFVPAGPVTVNKETYGNLVFPPECFAMGKYVYDGDPDTVGTIRMSWAYALPQDMTVAAELVEPGRECLASYGCKLHRMNRGGLLGVLGKVGTIKKELLEGESAPLMSKSDMHTNFDMWTLTPFQVTGTSVAACGEEKFLGQLWMIAPGLMNAQQLFSRASWANDKSLFAYRALTHVLLYVGWMLILSTPVRMVFGTGVVASVLSAGLMVVGFVLATSCWVTVSALACCTARPLRSTLLVATVLVFLYVSGKHHVTASE
ncbi:expressed unknown protein [Seminavis robusta]|uniref:Transmembrane protein n=1 Tax=Seminavis robusta TaxID=568900 RepID=A0A9N8DRL5_9STRA|nr:expressed unknown protein [Seminavis robusta]|eukprot:Sro232_g093890.1 n/a (515) ;mRNA; f:42650-44194